MRLLWVAAALLAVVAAVVGCGRVSGVSPAPAKTPSATTGSPSPTATPIAPGSVQAGSDGLTVRYTGDDGSIKTLRVEDFRR